MNSARTNGYDSQIMLRPSSEQMVDLHVYLVPPDIWREKFNNALNTNINDTVSVGFIRVHPETKVYQLREEIEQQLGTDIIPREYVFVKSVGRSLTRLKARQETTLKAKNFLPPQAYAPELYLLEATPEVRQAIAASSENSTRPQSRTSYEYEYMAKSDEGNHHAKNSSLPNGAGYQTHYQTLPHITPRNAIPEHESQPQSSRQPADAARQSSPVSVTNRSHPRSPPVVTKTSPTPRGRYSNSSDRPSDHRASDSEPRPNQTGARSGDTGHNYGHQGDDGGPSSSLVPGQYNTSRYDPTNTKAGPNVNRPPRDLRTRNTSSDSDPSLDPSRQQMVSSPRQRGHPQDEYLPPLSATPPHSSNEKHDRSSAGRHGNSHKHDEDSGIAGFTPETYRQNDNTSLDRRKDDVAANSHPHQQSDDDHQDDKDQSDWERRREEENERRRREEEERRRREEEEQRQRDEERDKIAGEANMMKSNSDEDLTRYPSPPPLRLASPDRDTASAKARRRKQKEALLKELEEAREARKLAERQREELVKNAKVMQNKTQNRRNHARDLWKKRYFEEKKKTGPLEEQSNRLRHELDIIHKRLLTTLEGPKEKNTKLGEIKGSKIGASPKPVSNFKIQATRLQHEIEDLRRRVEHAKMKLTGEVKLRNQAETELRALRAELIQKKINLTLSRNSNLTTYAPPAADVNFMTARSGITPRS